MKTSVKLWGNKLQTGTACFDRPLAFFPRSSVQTNAVLGSNRCEEGCSGSQGQQMTSSTDDTPPDEFLQNVTYEFNTVPYCTSSSGYDSHTVKEHYFQMYM